MLVATARLREQIRRHPYLNELSHRLYRCPRVEKGRSAQDAPLSAQARFARCMG
jgi:hypothetical protein